jgi:hypothetical protein
MEIDAKHDAVLHPVNSAGVILDGDLLWNDSGVARPASNFPWNTDLQTTQGDFSTVFIGVALESSMVGETKPIKVSRGVNIDIPFLYVSGTYAVGQAVGPAQGPGNTLSNFRLAAVANSDSAIGRCQYTGSASSVTKIPTRFSPVTLPYAASGKTGF